MPSFADMPNSKAAENGAKPNTGMVMPAGLCSTCNNASTCIYRARRGFDALYCDMFDDYTAPSARVSGHLGAKPIAASAKVGARKPVSNSYKGLCVNCENRESCTLPRPDEGVWHCEEYK